MERWYLACHKTGKHNALRVKAFLAHLNIEVLIPQIRMLQPRLDRPGQIRSVWEPLFPGYLFIHFDPETHHTSKVSACPGLSHLVRFAGVINPLHEAVVDEVLQLVLTVNVEADESIKQLVSPEHQAQSAPALTESQRRQIRRVMAEKNGVTRSALFYAFVEASRCCP